MSIKLVRYIFVVGLISGLILGACSDSTPPITAVPTDSAVTPASVTEAVVEAPPTSELSLPTPVATEVSAVYPEPGVDPAGAYPLPGAYPGPGAYPAPATPSDIYPPPGGESPAASPDPVTPVAAPAATPTPAQPRPTVDPQLHATDPKTVNLASGNVQLVEFFAFW